MAIRIEKNALSRAAQQLYRLRDDDLSVRCRVAALNVLQRLEPDGSFSPKLKQRTLKEAYNIIPQLARWKIENAFAALGYRGRHQILEKLASRQGITVVQKVYLALPDPISPKQQIINEMSQVIENLARSATGEEREIITFLESIKIAQIQAFNSLADCRVECSRLLITRWREEEDNIGLIERCEIAEQALKTVSGQLLDCRQELRESNALYNQSAATVKRNTKVYEIDVSRRDHALTVLRDQARRRVEEAAKPRPLYHAWRVVTDTAKGIWGGVKAIATGVHNTGLKLLGYRTDAGNNLIKQ